MNETQYKPGLTWGKRPALAISLGCIVTLLIAVPLASFAPVATAQDAPGGFEEIVVTARKRVESAQDVPVSIATFSGELLAQLNQATLLSIAGRSPSLQYSEAGGDAQLYIRGVGSNLLAIGADPSVAVNLDGVYLGRPGNSDGQAIRPLDDRGAAQLLGAVPTGSLLSERNDFASALGHPAPGRTWGLELTYQIKPR